MEADVASSRKGDAPTRKLMPLPESVSAPPDSSTAVPGGAQGGGAGVPPGGECSECSKLKRENFTLAQKLSNAEEVYEQLHDQKQSEDAKASLRKAQSTKAVHNLQKRLIASMQDVRKRASEATENQKVRKRQEQEIGELQDQVAAEQQRVQELTEENERMEAEARQYQRRLTDVNQLLPGLQSEAAKWRKAEQAAREECSTARSDLSVARARIQTIQGALDAANQAARARNTEKLSTSIQATVSQVSRTVQAGGGEGAGGCGQRAAEAKLLCEMISDLQAALAAEVIRASSVEAKSVGTSPPEPGALNDSPEEEKEGEGGAPTVQIGPHATPAAEEGEPEEVKAMRMEMLRLSEQLHRLTEVNKDLIREVDRLRVVRDAAEKRNMAASINATERGAPSPGGSRPQSAHSPPTASPSSPSAQYIRPRMSSASPPGAPPVNHAFSPLPTRLHSRALKQSGPLRVTIPLSVGTPGSTALPESGASDLDTSASNLDTSAPAQDASAPPLDASASQQDAESPSSSSSGSSHDADATPSSADAAVGVEDEGALVDALRRQQEAVIVEEVARREREREEEWRERSQREKKGLIQEARAVLLRAEAAWRAQAEQIRAQAERAERDKEETRIIMQAAAERADRDRLEALEREAAARERAEAASGREEGLRRALAAKEEAVEAARRVGEEERAGALRRDEELRRERDRIGADAERRLEQALEEARAARHEAEELQERLLRVEQEAAAERMAREEHLALERERVREASPGRAEAGVDTSEEGTLVETVAGTVGVGDGDSAPAGLAPQIESSRAGSEDGAAQAVADDAIAPDGEDWGVELGKSEGSGEARLSDSGLSDPGEHEDEPLDSRPLDLRELVGALGEKESGDDSYRGNVLELVERLASGAFERGAGPWAASVSVAAHVAADDSDAKDGSAEPDVNMAGMGGDGDGAGGSSAAGSGDGSERRGSDEWKSTEKSMGDLDVLISSITSEITTVLGRSSGRAGDVGGSEGGSHEGSEESDSGAWQITALPQEGRKGSQELDSDEGAWERSAPYEESETGLRDLMRRAQRVGGAFGTRTGGMLQREVERQLESAISPPSASFASSLPGRLLQHRPKGGKAGETAQLFDELRQRLSGRGKRPKQSADSSRNASPVSPDVGLSPATPPRASKGSPSTSGKQIPYRDADDFTPVSSADSSPYVEVSPGVGADPALRGRFFGDSGQVASSTSTSSVSSNEDFSSGKGRLWAERRGAMLGVIEGELRKKVEALIVLGKTDLQVSKHYTLTEFNLDISAVAAVRARMGSRASPPSPSKASTRNPKVGVKKRPGISPVKLRHSVPVRSPARSPPDPTRARNEAVALLKARAQLQGRRAGPST